MNRPLGETDHPIGPFVPSRELIDFATKHPEDFRDPAFDAWVAQLARESHRRDIGFLLLVLGGIALAVLLHRFSQ